MATDIDLDAVVQKVFDLLKADAKTSGLNWEKGRFSIYTVRSFPAGGVSFAPGIEIDRVTVPSGTGGVVPVRIMLWTSKHEGITESEKSVQDWIGKVVDVLFANTKLDVASFATKPWLASISVPEVDSNIEMTPPYAEAAIVAVYRARM